MSTRLAWWAFGLALAGFLGLTAVVALVIAFYALSIGARGKVLLSSAVVVSFAWVVALAAGATYLAVRDLDRHTGVGGLSDVALGNAVSPFDLKAGECFQDEKPTLDGEVHHTSAVRVVDCSKAHGYEVISTAEIGGSDYAGDGDMDALVHAACEAGMRARFRVTAAWDELGLVHYYPQAAQWNLGERTMVCTVTQVDGRVTGRVADHLSPAATSLPKFISDVPVGACYDSLHVGPDVDESTVRLHDCADAHESEVLSKDRVPMQWKRFPGEDAVEEFATQTCEDELVMELAPGLVDDDVFIGWWVPSADSWEAGDRTVQCTAAWDDAGAHPGRMAKVVAPGTAS